MSFPTKAIAVAPPKYKSVTGTTDIQTSSIDPVDMADMTLTVTTGANPILILAHVPISADESLPANSIWVGLVIDGEWKTIFSINSGMPYANLGTFVWLESLSAGTHTIKIQWYVAFATYVAHQLGESGFPRQLAVIELVNAKAL